MIHGERARDDRGRLAVIAIALAVLLAGGAAGVAAADGSGEGDGATISPELTAAEGEQVVLVYFGTGGVATAENGDGVTADQLEDRAREAQAPLDRYANATPGVTVQNNFWLGNVAVVEINHDRADVADLAAIDGVEQVGPNFEVTVGAGLAAAPTPSTVEPDAGYTDPGGVTLEAGTLSSHTTYGLEQINAPDVWSDDGTKGSGVTVTVLDTGVDPDHPDIDLGKWAEWDKNGNKLDTNPQDYGPGGHGTHASGTVSGGDASGTSIGVAPDVTLHHGAVLTDCDSSECTGTFAQITAGMQWAVDQNADVVSMSLGANGYFSDFIQPVRDARSAGTFVVVAAGNSGEGTSSSPGNVYDALSVGASDESRNIASFSSGEQIDTDSAWDSDAPSDWPGQYIVPTVSAPGVGVNSALPGGGYETKSGTSMATPHVSGAAALVQAATSADLSVSEIETALIETADNPNGDTQDDRYGHGIVDAKAAADYASGSQPANFAVTIDSTNSPINEGDTLSVDATVTNTGDESGTQSITLDVHGLGQDSTQETLSSGESTTVSLSVGTGSGDGGDYTATVASDDDSDSTGVTVEEPAEFAVTVDSTNSPVVEGETLSIDATVKNTGGTSDTQTITLDVPGLGQESTSKTLSGGESTVVSFSVGTGSGDAGDYTATLASDDDIDSAGVTVQAPANLAVTVDSATSPVVEGETLSVDATVENTGDASDTQSVALTVGGSERDATPVTLAGGESTTVTLTWGTQAGDAGEYTATVASDDDSDATGVTVTEPSIVAVAVDGTNSPVVEGETLSVDVAVENTGEESKSQSVALTVGGQQRDATDVSLAGGESTTVTLAWETGSGDAGEYTATVASDDETDAVDVSVQTPANLSVAVDGTNSPVFEGESLSVDATVENTGGATDSQSVSLTIGGEQRNATDVTLAGGESTTVTLAWQTGPGDAGEYEATLTTDDDRKSTAVTVQEPAEFAVEITDTNAPILKNGTLRVNATVENAGGVPDTQSITLTVGGQQRDAADVSLGPGENQSLALSWATGEDDAGEYDAVVASADRTAQQPVMVAEDESELGPPPVAGEEPPRDPDGDGRYEDVNGDGQFTVADVQVFFQQRDSDVVRENPGAFDFRPDGQVSIADVQLLFQQFLEQN